MNVWPLRLDTTIKSNLPGRQMAIGWLMMQLSEAAKRLWPEFDAEEPLPPPTGMPLVPRPEEKPHAPFLPAWMRRLRVTDEDEDGGI